MIDAVKRGCLHPFLHGYESSVAIGLLGSGQQLLQLLSKTFLSDKGPATQSMEVSYSLNAYASSAMSSLASWLSCSHYSQVMIFQM